MSWRLWVGRSVWVRLAGLPTYNSYTPMHNKQDREEGKVRWYKIDKEYFKEKEEKEGRDSVFKGRVRVVDRCGRSAVFVWLFGCCLAMESPMRICSLALTV